MGLLAKASANEPPEQVAEYKVKAAYLLNFSRYTEWPSQTFSDAAAPHLVCVLGNGTFARILEQTLKGRTSHGRPLGARVIHEPGTQEPCQVLFIRNGEEELARKVIEALGTRPVLTVGEGEEFIQAGGMLAFVVEQDSVRFYANQRAAQRSGLKLRSDMLQLAGKVLGAEPRGP